MNETFRALFDITFISFIKMSVWIAKKPFEIGKLITSKNKASK